MKIVTPDYYPQFHCIASACPDTCCAGWEVVVDPEAEKRYRSLEGALGGRLRASMGEDEGDCIFTPGGRPLPFSEPAEPLRYPGRPRGGRALPHLPPLPPFLNDFGGTREMGLSLSCPEAARMILTALPSPATGRKTIPNCRPT